MKNLPTGFLYSFLLILLAYLAVTVLFASTLLPNCDEAWFLLPGYNLIENGFFGTTVLDETATFRQVRLDGINHSTYWIMPLYSLVQGLWGKVNGFELIYGRLLSVFFGLIVLTSWASIIFKLTRDSFLTLLAIILIAVDYNFIYSSSLGRMDMMAVAFGVSSLAVYLEMRSKSLEKAILAAFTLTALSFFTHPLGLIWMISLTITVALLDFRRINLRHIMLAAVPYMAFALLWAIYILQAPDLFVLQFGGNASDRWTFFRAPLTEFWLEIRDRYFYNFGIGNGLSRLGQIRILILAIYGAAIMAVLLIKSLRHNILTRLILLLVLQEFIMLLLIDSMRQHLYMIYITPSFSIILAIWLNYLRNQKRIIKVTAIGLATAVLMINFSVIITRIRQDAYHNLYLETAHYLNQTAKSNDKIMASAEMWFALKNKNNLIDDFRLGYRSGKRADYIIMDKVRYHDWTSSLAQTDDDNYQYVLSLLQNDYEKVFENSNYQIYQRKSVLPN